MDGSSYAEASNCVLSIRNYFNNKKPKTDTPPTHLQRENQIPPLGPGSYYLRPTLDEGGTYQGYSFADTYAITPSLHDPIPAPSTIDVLPRMHEATVSRKGRGAQADIMIGENASRPGMTAYGD